MLGAILGDMVGSPYEFDHNNYKRKDFALLSEKSHFTDDTVMTVAVARGLMAGQGNAPKTFAEVQHEMRRLGKAYPNAGYGGMFRRWLRAEHPQPYGSFGNGAAMRVSYIAYHFDTLEKVEEEAKNSAMCTHNHIEGLKAAVATAGLIYLALHGERKKDLKKYFNKEFEYPVHKPLWAYRPKAKFDATAEGTMPLAFRCFMESEDWESCIRNVFSVKCDTDTVACIAGGIAGAYYKRTVENEKDLLKRYLIKPDKRKVGEFDRFLYDWATK